VVGMAATPSGNGYWLVASDGGIFTFGDAGFHGSTGSLSLNRPIVGMAATSDGGGYWLAAADGGVFCFGNAPFEGSEAGIALNQAIVGIAPPSGSNPYRLVGASGSIFINQSSLPPVLNSPGDPGTNLPEAPFALALPVAAAALTAAMFLIRRRRSVSNT
jgi:hypothetical protein